MNTDNPSPLSSPHSPFSSPKVFLPVIHSISTSQALHNARLSFDAGADGVFLINHSIPWTELLLIWQDLHRKHPDRWIGVNFLGLSPHNVFKVVPGEVNGIWVDNAGIREDLDD